MVTAKVAEEVGIVKEEVVQSERLADESPEVVLLDGVGTGPERGCAPLPRSGARCRTACAGPASCPWRSVPGWQGRGEGEPSGGTIGHSLAAQGTSGASGDLKEDQLLGRGSGRAGETML